MPMKIIVQKDGGIIVKLIGTFDDVNTLAYQSQLYAADEVNISVPYLLIDLTDVTEFKLSSSGMKQLAKQDECYLNNHPTLHIAIVAPSLLHFGMNRVYQAYVSDEQDRVSVHNELSDAQAWLANNLLQGATLNSN